MATQQSAINQAKQFVLEIKKTGLKIRRAFLYGSYAKNCQHKYSDIDVALVADDFIGIGFEDMKKFIGVLIKYTLIQPKTYSTADFKKGDPFIEEIKRTGIEIEIPKR